MSILSALVLGIVQGLTEFLPVSSSGHLSIFQSFFGMIDEGQNALFFDVLVHLGTLVSVCIVYRRDIGEMVSEFFKMLGSIGRPGAPKPTVGELSARRMILLIVISTLPLLLALPFKDKVEGLISNTIFIGFALIGTGCVLYFSDRLKPGRKRERNATVADALFVGLGQAIAVVPGLSRSGTTISAGLFRGYDREFAVKYSFLMSLPAIIGATILTFIDAVKAGIDPSQIPAYLVGFVSAGVFGYFAIRLIKFISRKGSFGWFAYYCWVAGGVTLVLSLIW